MERDQTTEQQNRRRGVGVFPQSEKTATEKDQSLDPSNQRKGIGIFQRPLRIAGFRSSLVVAIVIIIALITLAIMVF